MKTLTIGRSSSNDVVIQDSFVSGAHCSITLDDKGSFYLQDMGSSNGTFVNGKRVQQAWLKSNDIVKIGETLIPWQEYFESPNDSHLKGQVIRKVTLGRAPDNDVIIADEFVSSHHAEIAATDLNEFLVHDLNSTNGTFVNDRRVTSALLYPGDRLRLAKKTLEWTMFFSTPSHSELETSKKKLNPWPAIAISLGAIVVILLGIWGISSLKNSNKPSEISDTIPRDSSAIGADLPNMVKYIEKSVFVVKTYDRYGNGMQGTGFFIDESGLGVTNYHVVDGGTKWTIKTFNDEEYDIDNFIARNKEFDYAVFRIDNHGHKFNWLKRSQTIPQKGDEIFVLGNPQGIESTLTKGIVSSLRGGDEDDIMNGKFSSGTNYIQIDVAVSHGSSGSPVMNMKGEVVGIATLSFQEADCINCNFAVNIQLLSKYLKTE
jgi:pSer/pThr/pTyr-binding forkhead associated (FHA) protein